MDKIKKILEGFLGAVESDAHRHLLFPTNISSKCIVCSKYRLENTKGFTCNQCELYFHKDCIEITIPSHHRHPLKLHDRIIGYRMRDRCNLCEDKLLDMFYYCSRCKFDICMSCLKKPLVIDQPRAHQHPLSRMPNSSISFTCDACGGKGTYPYICLQCCFSIHKDCIDLPRVICINRHDHRISLVDILSPEKWTCGVCNDSIRNQYGAYSCSVCTYAVHSKCAIRDDVWDGRDLYGKPEEDGDEYQIKDIAPFEVVDENVIKHFSHEHILTFFNQDVLIRDETQRCYACILPISYYDACYICTHCEFILHETCANLPRIKRHELHKYHFTLYPNPKPGEDIELYKSFSHVLLVKEQATVLDMRVEM